MEITAGMLHLRPWRLDDADVVDRALRDPGIRRWATAARGAPDARTWLADRIEGWADGSAASFAVADSTTGEVLGHIRVRTRGDGTGEVGYWVLPESRGRGVAGHALGAVARWSFGCVGLSRLDLRHAAANPASCAVARGNGFALVRLVTLPSEDGGDGLVEAHLHTLAPPA
ncbi:GNAT family N-acetyltransferase [Planomonospora sp. ID82291]|uniref:GNAT family N-acetyltransferase n=1 Tax=Planomonospora sp. ID82291 TaxID=2738136 RepID=UPI001E54C0C4|nr:GNAT family N-acetyltransferase [Planomonospora sp. ID82291]